MRIGIDARTIFMPVMKGIGVYLENLLGALAKIDQENEYVLYYDSRQETVDRISSNGPQFTVRGISVPTGDRFYFWEQFALPRALARDKIDLLHSPANTTCLGWRGPKVVTIHDTTIQQKKGKSMIDTFYLNCFQPSVLRNVAKVITVSAFSRRNIENILKIDPAKVCVIHEGVSPVFRTDDQRPQTQDQRLKTKDLEVFGLRPACRTGRSSVFSLLYEYGISNRYILNVGGESPWKNVSRLIDAYAILANEFKIEENLVITGIRKKEIVDEHRSHISNLNLSGRVHILGFVPEEDLLALYQGAEVFVYPSLLEGFGFPPLEAMASGTPVAASDAASIPEVVGNAAILFDGENPVDIAGKLNRILSNPALRRTMIRRGLVRVTHFSWEKMARETLAIYQKAVRAD